MKVKLLALDMDGTTYHKMGEIVESNIEPLKQAIAQGIDVAIVTGRPVLAPQNKLIEHGIVGDKTVIVGCNGACVYDLSTQQVIGSNPISANLAIKAFELAQQAKYAGTIVWGYVDNLVDVILYHDSKYLRHNLPSQEFHYEENLFEGNYQYFENVKTNFNHQFFKLLIFEATPGFAQALKELGFEVATSDQITIEVNAPGINKKFAIDWLSQNWNVPIDQIMSIGDGANDLPMIEYAGIGVAMKNSIQAIKDIAQIYIDLTNDQGAVGEVIKQYVLK